jgi:hypothetical protein
VVYEGGRGRPAVPAARADEGPNAA